MVSYRLVKSGLFWRHRYVSMVMQNNCKRVLSIARRRHSLYLTKWSEAEEIYVRWIYGSRDMTVHRVLCRDSTASRTGRPGKFWVQTKQRINWEATALFHRGGPGSIPGQFMWGLWWTKWHRDRFSPPSTSVFPCQFHYNGAPLLGKIKRLIIFLFIFITGLHNKR
jgi:hypothetical protein